MIKIKSELIQTLVICLELVTDRVVIGSQDKEAPLLPRDQVILIQLRKGQLL